MNPMMMNNRMMNQMDKNQIFQMIQKNNEQIIQMIQQIFQVQMLNNMLLNQILNNNLNNNNINNNMFNDIKNINNLMNNMINNPNMNMMNNNMMNNSLKNEIDPWAGNNNPKINILFEETTGKRTILSAPENILVGELIDAFFKKAGILDPNQQKKISFLFRGIKINRADQSTLKEKGFGDGQQIEVFEYGKILGGQQIS